MLIGITGLASAGKSTVAKMMVDYHGFHRQRMADPLKNMLKVIGLSHEQVDGELKEIPCDLLCGKSPRYAMQILGTEFGRKLIGDDFWIRAWEAAYDEAKKYFSDVVVDDIRFPNEVWKIRERGGVILNVKRPGVVRGMHESETHRLPHDYVIDNDISIVELATVVANFLDVISFKES